MDGWWKMVLLRLSSLSKGVSSITKGRCGERRGIKQAHTFLCKKNLASSPFQWKETTKVCEHKLYMVSYVSSEMLGGVFSKLS